MRRHRRGGRAGPACGRFVVTDDPAREWEARYQEGRTGWERGRPNPAFLAWRSDGTLAPCRILVPGAGRSPEPAMLAEAGFDVTVLDAAESAVAFQTAALGERGRVVRTDLFAWAPDRPFDAIYDQTCLCALPPETWASYEARLRAWLRPGGRYFALFMQSRREGGPPWNCPVPAMRALFPQARWNWPVTLPALVPHSPDLGEQPAILERL